MTNKTTKSDLLGGVYIFAILFSIALVELYLVRKINALVAPVTTTATGICPEGHTGNPATSGCFPQTCEERIGQPCNCATCCNGTGCAGTINGKPGPMLRQCMCSCNELCPGGDDEDEEDDDDGGDGDGGGGGSGGGGDSPRAVQVHKSINEAIKKASQKSKQCSKFTGATRNACNASLARTLLANIGTRLSIS